MPEVASSIDDALRLGGRPAAAGRRWHDTVIYETHVKGFTMRHPDVREDLRGTYAGLASDAAIAYLHAPRRHRGRAAAGPPHRRRAASWPSGASRTTGATARSATSRRTRAYAATGRRGEQVREFKGMVKALHRAGIEVILDVVYNHTAEGNHLGPMLSLQGRRQPRLLPARCPTTRATTWTSPAPATPQPGPPERAAADHGLAALLGDRVPRRRLPLRPRLGARARVLRRRPAVGVLRRRSTRTRCCRRSS